MNAAGWALDVACRLVAIGVIVGALEQWSVREQFQPGGALFTPAHRMSRVRALVSRRHTLAVLVLAQLATALVVLASGVQTVLGWAALSVLTIAFVALRWFRHSGGDGAEQMASIVLITTVLVAPAFPGDARLALGVGFIAAQAVLAYSTSGIAKLVSPVWRDGTGLAGILSTVDHGTPALGQWLMRHPTLSRLASWGTIAFECAFVLVLVLPPPLAAGMLLAGLAFHAACAALMGLNSFLWAFPATYPCVWAAAEFVRGLASG
ncbi:MAG: hypothetical protein ABWX92_04855 [Mycetocola sp.]